MATTDRLLRMVERDQEWVRGDRMVVAVSGGPDSTALLHLLFALSREWGWQLTVAHANHGFRPKESAEEAKFVADMAADMGLPCLVRELDIPGVLRERGGNPQDVAREVRYRFLIDAARQVEAGKVLLAHHADDQAETVLMRILRGTGISGLVGISSKRSREKVELIRPLLRITKAELLAYLKERGIPYRMDSSNEKTTYTRNRIRLETIPALEKDYPQVRHALLRLASQASAEDDFLEGATAQAAERILIRKDARIGFSRAVFSDLHLALQRRLIKLILKYVSPKTGTSDYDTAELLREAVLQTRTSNLTLDGAGVTMLREYDRIWFEPAVRSEASSAPYCYSFNPESEPIGVILLPEASSKLIWKVEECRNSPAMDGVNASSEAAFDLEGLALPLYIRSRLPGDRMRVDGLNGTKKAKDIFIDAKIPPHARSLYPVIAGGDGQLLWIPGLRRSAEAKLTEQTRHRLVLRMESLYTESGTADGEQSPAGE